MGNSTFDNEETAQFFGSGYMQDSFSPLHGAPEFIDQYMNFEVEDGPSSDVKVENAESTSAPAFGAVGSDGAFPYNHSRPNQGSNPNIAPNFANEYIFSPRHLNINAANTFRDLPTASPSNYVYIGNSGGITDHTLQLILLNISELGRQSQVMAKSFDSMNTQFVICVERINNIIDRMNRRHPRARRDPLRRSTTADANQLPSQQGPQVNEGRDLPIRSAHTDNNGGFSGQYKHEDDEIQSMFTGDGSLGILADDGSAAMLANNGSEYLLPDDPFGTQL